MQAIILHLSSKLFFLESFNVDENRDAFCLYEDGDEYPCALDTDSVQGAFAAEGRALVQVDKGIRDDGVDMPNNHSDARETA